MSLIDAKKSQYVPYKFVENFMFAIQYDALALVLEKFQSYYFGLSSCKLVFLCSFCDISNFMVITLFLESSTLSLC